MEYNNVKDIVRDYKWANGFQEVKMNKIEQEFAETQIGGMWILCGGGLPLVAVIYLIGVALHLPIELLHFVAWVIGYFGLGFYFFYLSAICEVKAQYNKLIQESKQMNLFRDFKLTI